MSISAQLMTHPLISNENTSTLFNPISIYAPISHGSRFAKYLSVKLFNETVLLSTHMFWLRNTDWQIFQHKIVKIF